MIVLATLTYTQPLDVIAQHTDAHRAYMRDLHAEGKLVASGPFVPRTGGLLMLRVEKEEEVAALLARDPFHVHSLARYETRVWSPTVGADLFGG
jgi:uncharacterized protein YciI